MSSPQQSTAASTTTKNSEKVLDLLVRLLPNRNTTATPQAEGQITSSSADAPSGSSSGAPSNILGSQHEALAAISHAIMTEVGFRLVGLGEEDKLEANRKDIEDLAEANVLPERWNTSKDVYTFRYTHFNSQLTYLIKCMPIAGKFLIHGTTLETKKVCSLELVVDDFTSPSYFQKPTDLNRDPLWNGFISQWRVEDLIGKFKTGIVQILIPGLPKQEGATTSSTAETTTAESSTSAGRGRNDRGGHEPAYYPDDPSTFPGIGGIPRPGGPGMIPRPPIFGDPFAAEDPMSPFSIGHSDLDPFGGRFGGIGGIGGPGGFGGGIGGSTGGGMIVGPNHPMFRRPPGAAGGIGGGGGIYGGPQPLPRGSVPPGARFDPIGPFGPGSGSAPGAGTAHRPLPGQGRGRSTFPGEPDNDEAPPPGYMDMFM